MLTIKSVLIADDIEQECVDALLNAGIRVQKKTKLPEAALIHELRQHDAVIVRSATKVTRTVIAGAQPSLKLIGRAGTGVDNIDVTAATEHGVVVMNTPGVLAKSTIEMDEADGIFDKHIDFAALLKSAQSAIAAAQQQQHRRNGGITPQDSGSPPTAFASPTPSVSVGPESDISTLAKNLSHGHNNNGNGELSDVALLQQNQIISALKQQSLISPITQLALNSLSPFVPMQPVYAPSGYGRQILIYDSRSHPGRRREFAYKTRFTNQSGFTTVYYRCMACRALRHRLQRMLPKEDLPAVPCIAVKNDMLINDPDFPEASNHFCTPLTIEQSNERLKATFERGYKRARMKQAAEQEDNQTGAAIKRLAKPDSIGNDVSAASRATAPFSFSPLLWTAAAAANTSESAVCAEDPFKTTDTFSLRFPKVETTDDACTSTATTAMTSGSTLNTSITTSVDELNNGICRPAAETPTSSGSPRRRLDQLLRIRQQQIIQQQQQLQQQQHQHHIKIERDKSTSPDENFNVSIFAQKLLDNSASRSPPDFLTQLNSTFANANRSVNGASSLSGKSTPSVNGAMAAAAAGLGNGGIEATTFGEIGGMMISSLVNNLTQLGNGSHVAGQALAQLSGADTVTNNVAADASLFNNIQQAFAAQLRNGSAELLKALNNNNTNNNNHNNFNNYFNNNNNNNVFSAASLNPNFVLDFMSNNNNNVLVKNNNNIDNNAASSPYNNNSGNNINNNGEVLSLSPNEQLSDFLQKYVKNNWDLPENAGNSRSAAELTCTLILALARHVPQAAASMKQGKWARKDYMGEEVHGKTLAIIGLGRIGQEVASRMQAFGMKTVGFDPLVSVEEAAKRKIKWLPLEEIWPIADYITVHVPLIAQTRNLLSRETFAKCKRGARIVNVARGGIVSEEDLYEALNNGQIAGAALDVFCEEPPTHHSLINHPKVVSTPHIGASTLEAQQRVAVEIAENIVALNAGTGLNGALNGAALAAVLDPSKAQYVRAVSQLTQVLAALKPATKNVVVQFPSSADGLQKAFTAAATVGLLKASEVVGLNLVNAEVNAAKEGITVTVDQADAQSTELTVFDAHSGTSVAGYASPGGTMITAINGARAPFAVLAAGNLAIAKKPNEDLRAVTHNDEKLISKVTVEFSLLGGGCLALFNNNLSDEEVHRLAEHYTLVQFEDGNNNTGIDRNAEPAN